MVRAWKAAADLLARVVRAALPRNAVAAVRIRRSQVSLAKWYGNREGSIENVISELEAAIAVLPRDRPSPLWILGQRLLGEAYLHRETSEHANNSERGIAALEAAQRWGTAASDLHAWSATQANLGAQAS